MITYLTITLLISSICGLAILLLRNAPARLRFYICLMILVTWLTPWQLLQFEAVSNSLVLPLNILSEFNLVNSTAVITDTPLVDPVQEQASVPTQSFYWLWLAAFALGLALFFKDAVSYVKLHRHWIKHSTLDNQAWKIANIAQPSCDIRRITTQAPGMTTGLTHPIIWLDSEQHEDEKIRTIVLHELTHIRQHDPYWLWVINFVQRLFWWNPLILYTAKYARQQIELSCDEQCKKHLPDGSYQQQLIKLTIAANKQQDLLPMPAVLQMSGTGAFNLKRIHKLNEEHTMKKRHVLVLATLLSLTSWIGLSNATVNTEDAMGYPLASTDILEVLHSINKRDYKGAKAQLDLLTNNIASFEASKQAKVWKLNAHVLYELDANNPEILTYIDKAIALEGALSPSELLPILHMAQALAAGQEQWNKQLSYANKWLEVSDDNADTTQILYMIAVSQYSLENFDRANIVLNELIKSSESQGLTPKESWLQLMMANYVQIENSIEAYAVQEKITSLYPSKKNEQLLKDLAYML